MSICGSHYFSLLGILTIKSYSLVSVSVWGLSPIITEPPHPGSQSQEQVWGRCPACYVGPECTWGWHQWRVLWPQFHPSWQCDLIALRGFLPLFRSLAPLPQSLRERVSKGFCLCHSLLPLSPLCRKCHFVEALKP